jgi:hypothetical protein
VSHPDVPVDVLKYPFIPGAHLASCTKQVSFVLQHMVKFHSEQCVHGDARGFNIVFAKEAKKSGFIDFDRSAEPGTEYPATYQIHLPDTERHPSATPGKPMQFEHDWYSLAWLMRRHKAVSPPEEAGWKQAIQAVAEGRLLDAIVILGDSPCSLTAEPFSFSPDGGTGSVQLPGTLASSQTSPLIRVWQRKICFP